MCGEASGWVGPVLCMCGTTSGRDTASGGRDRRYAGGV